MSGTSIPLAVQAVNPWPAYTSQANILAQQANAARTQASIPLLQQQAQGQNLQNQQAALMLGVRRALYGAAVPGMQTQGANPLASAAGQSVGGMPSNAPLSGNALAGAAGMPNSAYSGANGVSSGSPLPQFGGVVTPAGFPMPTFQYLAAVSSPDPNKAFDNAFNIRRQVLAQSVAQADSPAAWDEAVRQNVQAGWLTPQEGVSWLGRYDLKPSIEASFANPESQLSYAGTLAGQGAMMTPQGPAPNPQMAAAAGNKAGAVAAAQGQYQPVELKVPTGQTDAQGNPTYRVITTTRANLPQATAQYSGAKPTTTADLLNPTLPITANTLVNRIATVESGNNYTTANQSGPGGTPTTSAAGGLQFTAPTWVSLVKAERPDLAQGKTDAQIAAMRFDGTPQGIALQQQIGADYARQNASVLTQAGIPPTSLSLGLAHQFGGEGAVNLLQAPPNTRITPALVGQAAYAANPSWQGKTVGQLTSASLSTYGINPVTFGAPNAPVVSAGGAPSGETAAGAAGAVPGVPAGAGAAPAAAAPSAFAASPGTATPPGVITGPPVLTPQQEAQRQLAIAQGKANITVGQAQQTANIGAVTSYRNTLLHDSQSAAQQNAVLDQMANEAANSYQGKFAPMAGTMNAWLDATAQAAGFKPDAAVGNWQAFNKNAMQLSTNILQSVGGQKGVQELQLIRQALPSDSMSPQGFGQVKDELQGLNDWRIAKSYASSHIPSGESPNQFDGQWNTSVSPIPFIVHRMSTQSFTTLAQNLNKTVGGRQELSKIINEMKVMDSAGLFSVAQVPVSTFAQAPQ